MGCWEIRYVSAAVGAGRLDRRVESNTVRTPTDIRGSAETARPARPKHRLRLTPRVCEACQGNNCQGVRRPREQYSATTRSFKRRGRGGCSSLAQLADTWERLLFTESEKYSRRGPRPRAALRSASKQRRSIS